MTPDNMYVIKKDGDGFFNEDGTVGMLSQASFFPSFEEAMEVHKALPLTRRIEMNILRLSDIIWKLEKDKSYAG